MRIVVTGGAGFLGSHLCRRLVREGNEVVALDNFITGREENVADLLEADASAHPPRFRLVRQDVTEYLEIPGRVDFVLHLASPASPIDYQTYPIQTLKVGSLGTHKALGLAKAKGAGFLLASTSEVYGDPQVHPQREDYWGHVNPIGPRGVYDEAKRFAEAMTMAYRRTHGVRTRIVRIFNTYGPAMRLDDGRAIPSFIGQALRGEPLTVYGDGRQTRSFCYVDDTVDGIVRLMRSDTPEPVNIGNPNEISILDLAAHVRRLVGTSVDVVHRPAAVDDPRVRQPDITRARERLGWEPRVGFEEGLRRTIEWFRTRVAGARAVVR